MEDKINNLSKKAKLLIAGCENETTLRVLYLRILGKSGEFASLLKHISSIPANRRKEVGLRINQLKSKLESEFTQKQGEFTRKKLTEYIDVTEPGRKFNLGHLHLVTAAIEEISTIFQNIGFSRIRYPEVEWEWYSFSSLNMPADHPARDDFETFFVHSQPSPKFGRMVLSPHTSSGQVREMERLNSTPPIRMINIAKCYRPNWDLSHTPMFHQFEGLVVDKGIEISHLKGTLEYFAREFFGPKREIRLRPFHFQFTEPSFEVDITCGLCQGNGCRFCKEGWLELGGSGMVHPNVLRAGRIDSQTYSGFAFGWGVERTYMMKEGLKINDLRLLYSNDIRFLEQF